MDDNVDDFFDTPIVPNLTNGLSKQTVLQNHSEEKNKENDGKIHVSRCNEENSTENGNGENIHKENSHLHSNDEQQDTNFNQTHELQGHLDKDPEKTITPDASSTQQSSRTPIEPKENKENEENSNISKNNDIEQTIPTKGGEPEDYHNELTRSNDQLQKQPTTPTQLGNTLPVLRLPSNDIIDRYESKHESKNITVASSPENNLKIEDITDTVDKYDKEEFPKTETKKNVSNEKSSDETILMDAETLKETTDNSTAVKQDDDITNAVSEDLMRARKTSLRESLENYTDDSSNTLSKNDEEKQDEQYKSIETKVDDSKIAEGKSDKDLDFENDSKRNDFSEKNKFFTGRLPTLISRNELIHLPKTSVNKKDDGETNSLDSKAVSKRESLQFAQESDEQNTYGEDRKAESSVENKKNGSPGHGDVRYIEGNPLLPSKQIQELLQEIKESPDGVNSDSNIRQKSLTDRSIQSKETTKRSPDGITLVQGGNEPIENSNNDERGNNMEMTVDDINNVTTKVLGTNYVADHSSRFDHMKQIKQIDEYVKQSKKEEHEPQTNTTTDKLNEANIETTKPKDVSTSERSETERIGDDSDLLSNSNKMMAQPSSSKRKNEINSESSKHKLENRQESLPPFSENKLHDSQNVNSSSTENDLSAIIASAKVAISAGTETTESHFGLGTTETSGFTLQSESVSHSKNRTSTSRTTSINMLSRTTQNDNQEALSSLICSNCLQADTRIHLAGYCTYCQQYLCNTCISAHNTNLVTRNHEIVPSYCKNELAVNKYVQATGYCADCSMFLCTKCVVQHCGFKAHRHHKIIQSSFVSKVSARKKEANEFLDKVQDKLESTTSEAPLDAKTEKKKKRKLIADLDKSSPYSSPFNHVPESLYPGPNKKISQSYTKHPKWAHSSILNLPYLVKPKPIPDQPFHASGHHKPVITYTKQKAGFDAMAAKFRSLKSKYKVKDLPKTARRREQALFTARPIKSRESFSLPDIDKLKSPMPQRRSVKPGIVQNTKTTTKDIEFINEHCLSIPFPRGEKRTEILAMAILMDGRLVVLDKNNNNIKLFNKSFHCIAALQFQNRLIDICASNLCPTDVYAATPKHIYEVSAIKGMDISRKMKVDIKRIEGIVSWKYGVAVISKKTNITWELRLLDYRGNLKSKLEVFNPFTLDIASSTLYNMTSSRGGKFISISDSKNACVITVDVTTRIVMHETMLEEGKQPTYLTSDGEGNHNLYVSCDNKVFQISKKGKVAGVLIDKAKENGEIGCIIYNKLNNRMYIKTGKDMISEYQMYY